MSNPRSRRAGRRGLLVVALALFLLLVVADLLRPDSLVRDLFTPGGPGTPAEDVIDEFRGRVGAPRR